MHLSPQILVGAYEFLRATAPFNKWSLPPADDVEFQVRRLKHFGHCVTDDEGKHPSRPPIIAISSSRCTRNHLLVETMAHEMVHLHQFTSAAKGRIPAPHGPKFRHLARQVCRQHGFDPRTF